MEQRSLKVLETDKTFFTKISTTISKILMPTKVGINGLLISIKRNNVLKAYEAYTENKTMEDTPKKEQFMQKYEETYSLYLEAIDKYIMDSVYKKVKAGTASSFESNALSKYYTVIRLKDEDYVEYKHKKQKYLLDLDYETVASLGKEKLSQKFNSFYLSKIEALYKGILKNYSIRFADIHNTRFNSHEEIYNGIFETLEEYANNILPLKIENNKDGISKELLEDFNKFERFNVGKLEERDKIEKKLILLGISRSLFTHSLPLAVAERCYISLMKQTRNLVVSATGKKKKEETYKLLLDIIEEYNIRLESTKVYWDNQEDKEDYKKFWNNYKRIIKLKQKHYIEYMKQRETLFIRADMRQLRKSNSNYSKIMKFYKQKLVENGDMKSLKNTCITKQGKFVKV